MPKSFFLHISQSKKPEFLREMADSKSATEKVQNDPGTSYCARKQRSTQKLIGTGQRAQDPLAKWEQSEHQNE